MMQLLQRRGGFQPAGGNAPANDGLEPLTLIFTAGILVVVLGLLIGMLITMSKALRLCKKRYRTMEPGQVWLNLIPCFNIFWSFKSIGALSEALRKEFRSRRLDGESSDYGKALGSSAAAVWFIGNFAANFVNKSGNAILMGIFSFGVLLLWFVLFVLYWVKISGFIKQLEADNEDSEVEEDEDDEDAPRRRRRRDAEEDDEDEQPRSRRRNFREEEEEDDERPRRRKPQRDDEFEVIDEEEPPRRRRRRDDDLDDEDDSPRRRR